MSLLASEICNDERGRRCIDPLSYACRGAIVSFDDLRWRLETAVLSPICQHHKRTGCSTPCLTRLLVYRFFDIPEMCFSTHLHMTITCGLLDSGKRLIAYENLNVVLLNECDELKRNIMRPKNM